jgi:dTDP-4-dehydrorhamnose reductase
MQEAGIDVPIEAMATAIVPGGVDRPLNGVLARKRADSLGLRSLRPWREALVDYMRQAGLTQS